MVTRRMRCPPPPHTHTGLLFSGDWEAAKEHAAHEGKWLLLNVQSPSEFASHRLNRDTWWVGGVGEMGGG